MMDATLPTSKNAVKVKFLLDLLLLIGSGTKNPGELSKKLNVSKQALNYHLKKLKRLNWIQKICDKPYAVYGTTPLGERVKQILVQSENPSPLYRCHSLIVGFDIKDFGKFDFSKFKLSKMNNWSYVVDKITDSIGEWNIHIQDTGMIKIYCPEIYSDDPSISFGQAYDIASRLAREYENQYGMKIGLMRIVREGHKELVNSEVLGKLFGKVNFGDIWVDKSTGSLWLEEKQSCNSIEKLLDVPQEIAGLKQHMIEQTRIMDELCRQMAIHLEAITGLRDGAFAMHDSIKEMNELLKQLNERNKI